MSCNLPGERRGPLVTSRAKSAILHPPAVRRNTPGPISRSLVRSASPFGGSGALNDRDPTGPSDDRISRLSTAILRISQSLDVATVLEEVVEIGREIVRIEQAIRDKDDRWIEEYGDLQACLKRIVELKDLHRSSSPGTMIHGFATWRSRRLPGGGF